MLFGLRSALGAAVLVAAALALIGVNAVPRGTPDAKVAGPKGAAATPAPVTGMKALPAAGASDAETSHEQAQRLMKAVDAILQDAAKNRSEARKLPADADYMLKPIWAETKEDRERKVRDLLDAVLAVITNAPVVELQKRIDGLRRNIRELDDGIVALREKQLVAPKDGMLTSMLSETVGSIGREIDEAKRRISANREEIAQTKAGIRDALRKNGVELTAEQVDLLLDGVLSGDLVRLVVVFNSARLIDTQLGRMMAASGENIGAARKYFAMHAALFALLVHAQDSLIGKIDKQYLPKLATIEIDIGNARVKTAELMRAQNRDDQKRALDANADSQRLAEDAAKGYRRYLLQQREQVAKARQRTVHDLRIADNTFETVEVSFQLRNLMRDASASFESIQKLEAPTFDQIFKNEELRREFENLTRRLDGPTS
jgi:polyhydroxyalkanoate synthesis regulator phasin